MCVLGARHRFFISHQQHDYIRGVKQGETSIKSNAARKSPAALLMVYINADQAAAAAKLYQKILSVAPARRRVDNPLGQRAAQAVANEERPV
jgi:hypothetical protein